MAKITEKLNSIDNEINLVKSKFREVYFQNDKPWIVGYSGGKDSSTVVHLLFEFIEELPIKERVKPIFIVSSDTLVENPIIKNELEGNLKKIYTKGKSLCANINVKLVNPEIDDTFWVNIIGRGYPSPNQTFRWCTDRMKIAPINKFITDVVKDSGEVVMILGVRQGESNSRDKVLAEHSTSESLLMKHTTLNNAYVFAPIISFDVDTVWHVLLDRVSPWGADNRKLWKLYSESSINAECPLIVDENIKETAGSCGNSRFGCWVCTVVNEDKSLSGFIASGNDWMQGLLDFRNWLTQIRDDRSKRMKFRTNGSIYFIEIDFRNDSFVIPNKGKRNKLVISKDGIDEDGNSWIILGSKREAYNYIKANNVELDINQDPRIVIFDHGRAFLLGLGPYTFETRMEILNKLLLTQRNLKAESNIDLITEDELRIINEIWISKGFVNGNVKDIYNEITQNDIDIKDDEFNFLNQDDYSLLAEICDNHNIDLVMLNKLIYIQKNSIGLINRKKVYQQISSVIKQDLSNL